MNYLNTLSYDYVSKLVHVTWNDIIYAIEKKFLNEDSAIDYAVDIVEREEKPSKEILALACLYKGEDIHPYIDELLKKIPETNDNNDSSKKKFLYVILFCLYENKQSYSDPLEIVEHIYADFDYPVEITSFVRYMPSNQPLFDSLELNIKQLYTNWEKYLDEQKKKYR